MWKFQLIPAPANTPLLPIQVSPSVAFTGDFRFDVTGGLLPSVATSGETVGAVIVTASLRYASPCNSPVNRRLLRDGTPTPKPPGGRWAGWFLTGPPRKMNPPYPENSTRWLTSLLTIASSATSSF